MISINNNFSVDDIHSIRENDATSFAKMSNEEIKKYLNEQNKIFFDSMNDIKNEELELV